MRFRKTLTRVLLAMGLAGALSAWAQQNPLTWNQVQCLVRDGLGDESGAKVIERRGIDFARAEDFLQSLKAAGASEVSLNALRAGKQPEPARRTLPVCPKLEGKLSVAQESGKLVLCRRYCVFVVTDSSFTVSKDESRRTSTLLTAVVMRSSGLSRWNWQPIAVFGVTN
jgi:hypothetical protein